MPARMGYSTRLASLLAQGKLEDARLLSRGLTPAGLKEEILRLPPRLGLVLCSVLRPARRAALFEQLSRREIQKLLNTATVSELHGLILSLPEKLVPEVFNALPSLKCGELLPRLPKNLRTLLKEREWPEDSVGAIMSAEPIVLAPDVTVRAALLKIRAEARAKDQVYHCFVVENGTFLGTAALEDLVLASPDTPVIRLTEDDCHPVAPETDRAEAARIMSRYDVQVLPVVKDGKLLGVLPFDDVLDVVQDENTELFRRAAGVYGENAATLRGDTFRRLPCLLLCLLTGIFTTGIIENYEALLSQVIALSLFVPLLIDTGGNVGGQISVLVIRSMSVGGLNGAGFWRVVGREAVTGALLGVAMAALAAGRSVLLGTGAGVTFVVGVSMVCVVVMSNLLGAVMPFAVKKAGLDPALLSGPLLATMNDVLGLMLYFSVAALIL